MIYQDGVRANKKARDDVDAVGAGGTLKKDNHAQM